METHSRKRIAIFLAHWPLQSQTVNCAEVFAREQYEVELYLSDIREYVELDHLARYPNLRIYNLSPPDAGVSLGAENPSGPVRFLVRVCFRVFAVYGKVRRAVLLVFGRDAGLLREGIVARAARLMAGKRYACLIGIEKGGLIWAGRVSARLGIPFIYYSLELYTDDFHRVPENQTLYFKRVRTAERRYHQKAFATIIQDPERAEILFRDNGVSMSAANLFYVPVSLLNGPYRHPSTFLYTELGIPRHHRIILYVGQIAEERYAVELVQQAQRFPDNWTLVFHGWGDEALIDRIRVIDRRRKVALSLDMVRFADLARVIASSDVGLAFYRPVLHNDRLTAFSSEKIACYLQCGVPFVGFDYPAMQRLVLEERCGAVIHDLGELGGAVAGLLDQRETFRRNAYSAFEKYFRFERNFASVIHAIEHVAAIRPLVRAHHFAQ